MNVGGWSCFGGINARVLFVVAVAAAMSGSFRNVWDKEVNWEPGGEREKKEREKEGENKIGWR